MNMLYVVMAVLSFPFWENSIAFIGNIWKGEYFDRKTGNVVEIATHERMFTALLSFLSAIIALCLCYPILLELNILEKV